MAEELKELSDKHKLFVYEYINNNFNGTKAYMAVYGAEYDTARANASDLLSNTNIRQAVDKAIDDSILADKKELAKKVIEEYKKIAFSDVKNYIDPITGQTTITDETDTAALESVQFDTMTRDNERTLEKTRYKMYNKINALDSLSKFILGFAEKHEVDHSGEVKLIVEIVKNEAE